MRLSGYETDAYFLTSTEKMARELSAHEKLPATDATVFVYFTASWCGPCKKVSPVFEELARTSSCDFFKVDVDPHTALCDRFRIDSIPTVVVLKNSKEIERIYAQEKSLRALVSKYSN